MFIFILAGYTSHALLVCVSIQRLIRTLDVHLITCQYSSSVCSCEKNKGIYPGNARIQITGHELLK